MQTSSFSIDRALGRARRTAIIIGVIVLALLATGTVASGWLLYKAGIDDWREDLGTLSTALAENTAQTLSSVHLVLDSIAADIELVKIANVMQLRQEFGSAQFGRMLDETIKGIPQISAIALIDRTGQLVALSHEYPAPSINVSDREYFRHHRDDPSVEDYLGEANIARYSGETNFYLTRRVNDSQGRFLGIIVVALPHSFFENFFAAVSKEKPFSIILYRTDYKPLAWHVSAETKPVPVERGDAPPIEIKNLFAGNALRADENARYYQDPRRLGIQRRVRDFPVLIEISITDTVYFDDWMQTMYPIITVSVVSILGLLTAFYFVLRQLNRREEDAEKAIILKNEADSANIAKSRFLAMVSHEVRTPMNGMLGLSDLLLETDLSLQQKHYADGIHTAANSLLRIINDILDLSKIESGRIDLECVPFRPKNLAQDVLELYEPLTKKKGLRLESSINCADDLFLLGDPARVSQILRNLLSNAIKFTQDGSVTLTMAVQNNENGFRTLTCSVIDSGIGIPLDAIDHVFEPFSQADSSISRRFGGTGLGLNICKNLVELMGGSISCSSVPGVSTSFRFYIKCLEVDKPKIPTSSLVSQGEKVDETVPQSDLPGQSALDTVSSSPEANEQKSVRILVAEDADINRQLVRILLARLGYVPDEVINGQQALAAVRENAYDLILMDCMMPLMDGYEATRLIRARELDLTLNHTPIIALTASAIEGDRQRCLDAGMDDYLSKPFSPKTLTEIIQKWLNH
jgi:signal transduction histidine kinase/CheY-like chemotaxis protein